MEGWEDMRFIARHLLGLAIGTVALTGLSMSASAGVIDFEGAPYVNGFDLVTAGPNLPTTDPGVTFQVSTTATGPGVSVFVYDTNNTANLDPDQDAPFDDPTTPAVETFLPGNIAVIGTVNSDRLVNDTVDKGLMTFQLSETVEFLSFQAFDIGDSEAALDIFVNGINVGSVGGLKDNEFRTFSYAADSFGEITSFSFQGSGGIDNIVFNTPGTDIPEPATLALIGTGLLAAGALTRRRRRT